MTRSEQNAIDLIAAERQRQVGEEGWTASHDNSHAHGELARAAACYARQSRRGVVSGEPPEDWPWDRGWWKPSMDPVRDLVKAGALIAAEIDRIQLLRPQKENT